MTTTPTSFGMLRLWNTGDAENLAKYANNRKIWINLRDGFPFPYTIKHARGFLAMVAQQKPITFYAIATPEEVIGGIGLTIKLSKTDVHRLTAELGYWLAELYWGKGIMTESVTRFVDFAFEHCGLVRIYAEPYVTNTASCRVLQKAGFELEGRMRSSVIN